jgi:hypothetical protein
MMFRSSSVSTRSLGVISMGFCHSAARNERPSRVPNHASVLDADLVVRVVHLGHLLHTLVERFLSPAGSELRSEPHHSCAWLE